MTIQHARHIVKSLFIVFMIVVCIYLLPRVAINAFYYPDNKVYGSTPAKAESIIFTAKDGTQLHGWFIPSSTGPAENAIATVVHAHGNAGNMSAHWPLVSWLPERNVNLFMFDYRGFGESKGTPTQKGLLDDTQSAMDYVRHRPDVNTERLVLLGQSLGGNNVLAAVGNCMDCVHQRHGNRTGVRAIILDSTFSSYSAIANYMIPGSGFLLNDRYSADRNISSIAPIPLLLLHGTADYVIPWQHSEALFAKAGEPKQIIIIPDGVHIDAFSERHGEIYRDAAMDFIRHAVE
ncbi:alpha/beta hydrolase [Citrobacter farmeri]|uniref:alpha/beta hydrolase n=1 Tax=Citrobacter farmeri TaxID=67824 RepID=UPI00388E1B36|nr:alpha/beta hydrolase [Citrobacter farmeri]